MIARRIVIRWLQPRISWILNNKKAEILKVKKMNISLKSIQTSPKEQEEHCCSIQTSPKEREEHSS